MFKDKLYKRLVLFFGVFMCICGAVSTIVRSRAATSTVIYSEEGDCRDYITGTGTYFDWKRAFYKDGNNQVAYCTQSDRTPAVNNETAYEKNTAAIYGSDELHKAITTIASNGYPLKYGKYIIAGTDDDPQYISGLIIGKNIYKCTRNEARAATAFAIHRKLLDYSDSEHAAGNDVTILSVTNGKQAKNDIVELQEELYKNSSGDYSVDIVWVKRNIDGTYKKTSSAVISQNDGKNLHYYLKVTSDNCYVDKITVLTGDKYVPGVKIDEIQYGNCFEQYVHLKVPVTAAPDKKFGIKCYTNVSSVEKAVTLGSETYQDFIVVPVGEEINKSIAADYPTGSIEINKTDKATQFPVKDAEYGVYSDDTCKKLVAGIKTDNTGVARLDDIKTGTYYVKENKAPLGYKLDQTVYRLTVHGDEAVRLDVSDELVELSVKLIKNDDTTKSNVSQGDATLSGAQYGLFAAHDIMHPSGNPDIVYKKDSLIDVLITDSSGAAQRAGLFPGEYYIRELEPPVGYLADDKVYPVDFTNPATIAKNPTYELKVFEKVNKQAFRLKKLKQGNGDKTEPLENAGFSVWLISDLKVKADGTYDFSSANPCVITADGKTEMFTDEDGCACSIELPYGYYIVKETTVPDGYAPVDDFIIEICEDSREPQEWIQLKDEQYKTGLKIIKKDADSKRKILKPGFGFKIYDIDKKCYVEQELSSENKKTDTYYTDEKGELVLPEGLPVGNYQITEVECPEGSGYKLSDKTIDIAITADMFVESVDDIPIYEVEFFNEPVYGRLIIKKQIEKKGILMNPVAGKAGNTSIEFELFAAEDIYSYDSGDERTEDDIVYKKNQLVKTISFDYTKAKECSIDNLHIGKYYLKEKKTVDGCVLNEDIINVSIYMSDRTASHIVEEVTVINKPTTTKIYKKDEKTDELIKGAKLCVTDEEGNIYDTWVSDGREHVIYGLVDGKRYILRELTPPDGYEKGDDVYFVAGDNSEAVVMYNIRKKVILGETGYEETPHTGDGFNPLVYVGLVLSVIGIIAFCFRLKD